ncbi:hypothetical protein NDU88_006444 [Pleurodeles waltl]|uniref:Uncharacterized protein n=1 Tax=Pleurodeles waltl TaxID=8319 RepID=A0AAV7ULM6_PLEWA|nr:hypothetical protein NDU88_006444 [Pleurodeles waltl]
MERILLDVTAVGCGLEYMNTKISALADETKHICTHITGFQGRVEGMELRLTAEEDRLSNVPDSELLYLWDKLMDLEDQSHRHNFSFFGFPELVEGADIKVILKGLIPSLAGLTFTPSFELQWAHR